MHDISKMLYAQMVLIQNFSLCSFSNDAVRVYADVSLPVQSFVFREVYTSAASANLTPEHKVSGKMSYFPTVMKVISCIHDGCRFSWQNQQQPARNERLL